MIQKIAELFEQAHQQNGGRVWLNGYRNSEGKVANYLLQLQPVTFYGDLITETIALLEDILKPTDQPVKESTQKIENAADVDRPALLFAANDLLAGMRDKVGKHASASGYAPSVPAHPNLDWLSPDTAMLKNIEVLDTVILSEPPAKVKRATKVGMPPTSIVRAEKYLRDVWPMKRYGASFKLEAGKFTSFAIAPPPPPLS